MIAINLVRKLEEAYPQYISLVNTNLFATDASLVVFFFNLRQKTWHSIFATRVILYVAIASRGVTRDFKTKYQEASQNHVELGRNELGKLDRIYWVCGIYLMQ